jgi:hypothetical protein
LFEITILEQIITFDSNFGSSSVLPFWKSQGVLFKKREVLSSVVIIVIQSSSEILFFEQISCASSVQILYLFHSVKSLCECVSALHSKSVMGKQLNCYLDLPMEKKLSPPPPADPEMEEEPLATRQQTEVGVGGDAGDVEREGVQVHTGVGQEEQLS